MVEIRLPRALLLLSWLAGCVGGDTGTEGSRRPCNDRTGETTLGPDGQTPYATPRALAAWSQGEHETELRFWTSNGTEVPPTLHETHATLEITVGLDSARLVEWKDRVWPDMKCPPEVELNAVLRLETSDGTFAERIPGRISFKTQGHPTAFFAGQLALQDMRGSYPVGDDDPRLGPLQVYVHLGAQTWHATGAAVDWSGSVSLSHSAIREFSRYVAEW